MPGSSAHQDAVLAIDSTMMEAFQFQEQLVQTQSLQTVWSSKGRWRFNQKHFFG